MAKTTFVKESDAGRAEAIKLGEIRSWFHDATEPDDASPMVLEMSAARATLERVALDGGLPAVYEWLAELKMPLVDRLRASRQPPLDSYGRAVLARVQ